MNTERKIQPNRCIHIAAAKKVYSETPVPEGTEIVCPHPDCFTRFLQTDEGAFYIKGIQRCNVIAIEIESINRILNSQKKPPSEKRRTKLQDKKSEILTRARKLGIVVNPSPSLC